MLSKRSSLESCTVELFSNQMAEGQGQSDGPPQKRRKTASGEEKPEPKLTDDKENSKQPLLFFFHVGTTGCNISQDRIVELSGKVISIGDQCPHATQPTFNSLVYTSHPFHPKGRDTSLHLSLL